MPVFVFDAYGTLFDVHAAIAKHRSAAGPDADRLSELWRSKQLEYTWTLTLAGRYVDFWTCRRNTPTRRRRRCCRICAV
jgi:2-haloacid dehalogenase